MFTGIITNTGEIESALRSRLTIRARPTTIRALKRGASIAVDGACLTVVRKTADSFTADIMQETARRTTLGELRRGNIVNLELPATPSSFLSGHIVQGHVDGVGVVEKIIPAEHGRVIEMAIPQSLARYVVPRGSIALNGVSLTVISASAHRFTVGIIPHTWGETTLRTLKAGSRVNIEADVLAKYVDKLVLKKRI